MLSELMDTVCEFDTVSGALCRLGISVVVLSVAVVDVEDVATAVMALNFLKR